MLQQKRDQRHLCHHLNYPDTKPDHRVALCYLLHPPSFEPWKAPRVQGRTKRPGPQGFAQGALDQLAQGGDIKIAQNSPASILSNNDLWASSRRRSNSSPLQISHSSHSTSQTKANCFENLSRTALMLVLLAGPAKRYSTLHLGLGETFPSNSQELGTAGGLSSRACSYVGWP